MPLVFNRQSSQPFPNKYATKFSHPLWTTCPSALLSFFFFLLLFLARFLLTVPCLWYLTVNHRNRFQISTQLSFPIRSGQLVPQLFSFFFFFLFFLFFFPPSFPCSLSSYRAMPLVFNRQSSQPFPNKYATTFSHPLWTTCPSALLSFFLFFFLFFLFFFPPSFPCSLSSYRAMPLVFNRQSSQPFPNKYATTFSHPLWTTCPSALLSFFFFFLFFFFFFFFPPSFPCSLSSYRAMPLVFNRQSSQPFLNKYTTKFSHPLWTTCPSAFLSFFFFFFFFFFPPSFPCSLSSYRAMPLVFNRQSSQPFPNKYATKFSHPLWTTCPSALLSFFFFFFLFFLFFSSFFSLLAFFLPCHAFGI